MRRLHWLALVPTALHPAALMTHLTRAEPFELAPVFAIEALILGGIGAWFAPPIDSKRFPLPPQMTVRIDGFDAEWKAEPDLDEGEAFVFGLLSGAVAAVGAAVWLYIGFRLRPGMASAEPGMLVFVAVLFAGVAGVIQAVGSFVVRWVLNAIRGRVRVNVAPHGRRFEWEEHTWLLQHEDSYRVDDGDLMVERDAEKLRVPAYPVAASAVVAALNEARPPPDDGQVPEALEDLMDAQDS